MRTLNIFLVFMLFWSACNPTDEPVNKTRPNILWIYVEDISPDLGTYGNELVSTPHLDLLAEKGVRFNQVISPAPVCSPVRSAMITGLMPTTIGIHQHHSSRTESSAIRLPDSIKTVAQIFKDAGYFTFNHGKDDYNFWYDRKEHYSGAYTVHPLYGKSGTAIDWNQRPDPEQPFFGQIQLRGGKHVFNRSFDSLIRRPVDRAKITLPPYYVQDSIFIEEWARYLDSHQITDDEVGAIIERLRNDGVLQNTIVFFFSDHGMRGLRHKQFVYDGGLKVPLIIANFTNMELPENSIREGMVSLLDVPATSLALADLAVPDYFVGRNLFAGNYQPHEYIIATRDRCDFTIDRIRAVRSESFKYIRNFKTDRKLLQPNYRDAWESTQKYRQLHADGQLNELQARLLADRLPEELYDLSNDPHETRNLAEDPDYEQILQQYRNQLNHWINQTGDQGQYPEDEDNLGYMLAIWGEQAVNPEYDSLRLKFPELSGSMTSARFAKPQLIE